MSDWQVEQQMGEIERLKREQDLVRLENARWVRLFRTVSQEADQLRAGLTEIGQALARLVR